MKLTNKSRVKEVELRTVGHGTPFIYMNGGYHFAATVVAELAVKYRVRDLDQHGAVTDLPGHTLVVPIRIDEIIYTIK